MTTNYILEGHIAIPEPDILKWAAWYETANRVVAQTSVGDVRVSTVFLGLDHSFGEGPKQLFETMVFGGEMNEEQTRYQNWSQAEAGHAEMVERVKSVQ